MKKVLDKVAEILLTVAGFLFLAIFAVNMLEIISRSFFNYSFLWVSDFSIICVVWTICLSIAVGVYRREHLVMEYLADKLPPKSRRALAIVISLISIAFFLTLFYTGAQTAATKRELIFPSIQWSLVWAYSALPVFAILSAVFMIPRLISQIKGEESKRDVTTESIF
ncbi:MAG: TRAP transporter small permease [Clostridia bacterium]